MNIKINSTARLVALSMLLAGAVGAAEVHEDGLYSTIAGYMSLPKEKPKWGEVKLKPATFAREVKAKELRADGGDLVVLLLGLEGQSDGPMASGWARLLHDRGYNVLTFDSTFSASMNRSTKHGAPGYLPKDAEAAAKIVEAYLAARKGAFERVVVVGISYGGLVALEMSAMQQEGTLPFKIKSAAAYSPPVDVRKTAAKLDLWFATDRQEFKLTELAWKIMGHEPVGPGEPVPFSQAEMRAFIAAVFRMSLKELVFYCDRAYGLGVLPKGGEPDSEYVAKDHAGLWGFTKYVDEICAPYWKKETDDLLAAASLESLLKRAGECEVYLTDDDPFNDEGATEALRDKRVTVRKDGGHVGFTSSGWLADSMSELFK
jgi:predicted alpha/beta-fold hydrolase